MTAPHSHGAAAAAPSAARALATAGVVIVFAVLLDQASKWAILQYFSTRFPVVEVTGFFNLALSFNTGISFGIFRGGDAWVRWALIVVALGIVAVLLEWLRREPSTTLSLAIGLICGGALGNVIDRIRIGAVVDYLDFYLGDWHWPAFNLADTMIAIGVFGLILDGLFRKPGDSKN